MTAMRGRSAIAWLKTVQLQWPAAQTTLLDLEGMIDVLAHRRDHLEREIVATLPGSPWATQVGRLRCLRGVDTDRGRAVRRDRRLRTVRAG